MRGSIVYNPPTLCGGCGPPSQLSENESKHTTRSKGWSTACSAFSHTQFELGYITLSVVQTVVWVCGFSSKCKLSYSRIGFVLTTFAIRDFLLCFFVSINQNNSFIPNSCRIESIGVINKQHPYWGMLTVKSNTYVCHTFDWRWPHCQH